jgi:carbonyl reductase 1
MEISLNKVKFLILRACKSDKYKSLGYPSQAYNMSKVAVNALTRVQQKMIDADKTRTGILVLCACPGYCKTDMTRGGGLLTAEQGEN